MYYLCLFFFDGSALNKPLPRRFSQPGCVHGLGLVLDYLRSVMELD